MSDFVGMFIALHQQWVRRLPSRSTHESGKGLYGVAMSLCLLPSAVFTAMFCGAIYRTILAYYLRDAAPFRGVPRIVMTAASVGLATGIFFGLWLFARELARAATK
jgi:hypothetical protein